MLVGRVHFFLVSVKKDPGLCFNSRYNFLLRKQPCQVGLKSCLTICVVFWTDTVFLRLNKADKLYTGGFSREKRSYFKNCSNSWWASYIEMLQNAAKCCVSVPFKWNLITIVSLWSACQGTQWVLYRKRMTQRNKSQYRNEDSTWGLQHELRLKALLNRFRMFFWKPRQMLHCSYFWYRVDLNFDSLTVGSYILLYHQTMEQLFGRWIKIDESKVLKLWNVRHRKNSRDTYWPFFVTYLKAPVKVKWTWKDPMQKCRHKTTVGVVDLLWLWQKLWEKTLFTHFITLNSN